MDFKNYKIKNLKILIPALLVVVFFGWNYSKAAIISKSSSNNTLQNGLIGWWTMDGADTTASTATDKSVTGNNGTRTGTTTVATGKIGQGMKFDGASGYISLASIPAIDATGDFSISTWVKADTTVGTKQIFGKVLVSANRVGLKIVDGNILGQVWDGTGWTGVGQTLTTNKWHHVVYTSTNKTMWIYVDGVPSNAVLTGSSTGGTATARIGAHLDGLTEQFKGYLDDFRIYNRVISKAEIAQLYSMGGNKINKTDAIKPTFKTGLVGHWTFDGADINATQALDKSGNNNPGQRGNQKFIVGKIGQGVKFDGSASNISVTSTDVLNFNYNENFSVAMWVKIPPTQVNTAATVNLIISKSGANYPFVWQVYNQTYSVEASRGKIKMARYDGTFNPSVVTPVAVNDNKWHFLVFTKNSSILSDYVDGVFGSQGTDTTVSPTTNTAALILGAQLGVANPLTGSMDDVRIYNRALSAAEIAQLYTMGGGKISKTDLVRAQLRSGLVGHWTFDGGDVTANTTTDRSGQGNNGTRTAVTPVVGKIGQAMKFDGVNGRIAITQSVLTSSPYSISFWFKNSPLATGATYFPFQASASSFPRIQWQGTTNKMLFQGASNGYQYSKAINKPFNTWHLYTVTIPSSSATLLHTYIDGVVSENAPISTDVLSSPGNSWNIGWFSGFPYLGDLDDVRVYNRALSAAEVTQLYRMGR